MVKHGARHRVVSGRKRDVNWSGTEANSVRGTDSSQVQGSAFFKVSGDAG